MKKSDYSFCLNGEISLYLKYQQILLFLLNRSNPNVNVVPYKIQLDNKNALDIIREYDVVLDATDNVPTRYLLNDACVLTGKPLVSGSALKLEGQLSVYNYKGPCYRCIFPKPPPPETVTNCGDGGVLGAIVGVIGVMQAMEALKLLLGGNMTVLNGRLFLFDGADSTTRIVRLRAKNPNCMICGDSPTFARLIDYERFCNSKANDKNPNVEILEPNERISVKELCDLTKKGISHLIIDVRSNEEFMMCRLENSINFPFTEINCKRRECVMSELTKVTDAKEGENLKSN